MKVKRTIVLIVVGVIIIGLLSGFFLALGVWSSKKGGNGDKATGALNAGICANIPLPYLEIFKNAGAKYEVQPAMIGAIFVGEHQSVKETNYKTWPDPNGPWSTSGPGAQGPFQFMPGTWAGYKQDGDNDGKTNVQNLTDSAFGAANLLSKIGAGGNTANEYQLRDAASRYNSGRPWNTKNSKGQSGQDFAETRKYVEQLVIPAFRQFYCPGGRITTIAGTFDPITGGNDNVPLYRQNDQRYTNDQTGGKNFSIWGCCPTSAAMVMRFHGAAIDPIKAAAITVQGGFYSGSGGTSHSKSWLKALSANFDFTKQEVIPTSSGGTGWNRVIELLGNNKPLIARGDGAKPYSQLGHCIVLTGYDKKTGLIRINNPISGLGDGPFPLEHIKKYTTVVYYLDK